MAKTRQVWLKAIGTAEKPFPDNWLDERPDILHDVRFPKQPSGVKSGDLLVYYASGKKKLFALARSTMDGASAPHEMTVDEKRWAYKLPVQVLAAIPTLPFALDYAVLKKTPGAVRQQSHIELTDAEYGLFLDALYAKLVTALNK